MSSCPLTWASGPAHNSAQIACARPPLGTGHRCGRVPQKFTPALRLPDGGGGPGPGYPRKSMEQWGSLSPPACHLPSDPTSLGSWGAH